MNERAASSEQRAASRLAELIAVVLVGGCVTPGVASAQAFTPATVTTTVTVPFVMDSSFTSIPPFLPSPMRQPTDQVAEFVGDPFGGQSPNATEAGVPWATQRIAGNVRMRYRIMGNPFMRRAGITFTHFAMNTIAPADHVTLGWAGVAPATLFGNPSDVPEGNWPWPVTTTVYETGTNSLAFPGMLFNVVTFPDLPATSAGDALDRESWGFESASINVWGNGTQGNTLLSILGIYESAIAVLMPTNDVTRAIIANTGHPVTVAVWAPPGPFVGSVTLYARCGADPTATAWDRKSILAQPGRAVFQMAPCPSGQSMRIAITNTGYASPRAVRVYVGSNRTDREYNLRVGVAFAANPAFMSQLQQRFQRAAWMFFGLTGGTQIMRSFTFYNNATNCSNTPSTACSGYACDACVFDNPAGTAFCHEAVGRMHLYTQNDEGTIAHEMGHCFTRNGGIDGLRDEYESRCGGVVENCSHTWMSMKINNEFTLCNDQTHGMTGVHFNLMRSQDRVFQGCSPLQSWGYYGNPPGGTPSQDSGWRWLNGRIPAPYPADRTPEVLWMERFWNSTLIGQIN